MNDSSYEAKLKDTKLRERESDNINTDAPPQEIILGAVDKFEEQEKLKHRILQQLASMESSSSQNISSSDTSSSPKSGSLHSNSEEKWAAIEERQKDKELKRRAKKGVVKCTNSLAK